MGIIVRYYEREIIVTWNVIIKRKSRKFCMGTQSNIYTHIHKHSVFVVIYLAILVSRLYICIYHHMYVHNLLAGRRKI